MLYVFLNNSVCWIISSKIKWRIDSTKKWIPWTDDVGKGENLDKMETKIHKEKKIKQKENN